MNCQDFEASVNDLARDQIMDSAMRAGALAHSEGCRACAARLADERTLSAGLRRLAASASDEQAPAKVEAALIAAFRERKQTPAAPVVAPIRPNRWRRWAVVAAAAVLILIALVALRANQPAPEPEQKANNARPDEIQPAPPAVQPLPEQKSPVAPRNRKRELQNHYAANRTPRAAPPAEDKETAGDYEIATDFIPLTHRGSFAQWEGGQVVRVELPRSAMASFGLPVNLERAGERVKADVVVGNDGMARAIRFVR
jgi:hypothetical protein